MQDTEEIKNLSAAEQKIKIMEIIKKIDTNADKLLNAGNVCIILFQQLIWKWICDWACFIFFTEELTAWIQHVYRKYALDDAKERFSEFDTDKDGGVSWEEYNTVSHGQLISFDDPASPDDPEKESLRYVRVAFTNNHSITT